MNDREMQTKQVMLVLEGGGKIPDALAIAAIRVAVVEMIVRCQGSEATLFGKLNTYIYYRDGQGQVRGHGAQMPFRTVIALPSHPVEPLTARLVRADNDYQFDPFERSLYQRITLTIEVVEQQQRTVAADGGQALAERALPGEDADPAAAAPAVAPAPVEDAEPAERVAPPAWAMEALVQATTAEEARLASGHPTPVAGEDAPGQDDPVEKGVAEGRTEVTPSVEKDVAQDEERAKVRASAVAAEELVVPPDSEPTAPESPAPEAAAATPAAPSPADGEQARAPKPVRTPPETHAPPVAQPHQQPQPMEPEIIVWKPFPKEEAPGIAS